jgi:hypothetical protein
MEVSCKQNAVSLGDTNTQRTLAHSPNWHLFTLVLTVPTVSGIGHTSQVIVSLEPKISSPGPLFYGAKGPP